MAVRINSAYDAAKYYASRATKSTPSKATSNTVKSSSSIRSSSKTNVSRDVKITSKNATSATNNKKSASAVSNAATAIKSTKNNNTKTNVSVTIPVLNIAKAVTSTVTKAAKTVTGKAANSTTKTSAKTNVANTTSARKAAVASNTASMKSSSTTKSTVSTAYTAPTKATNVTKTVAPILNVVNTVTNRAKAAISSSKKNVATTSVPTNVGKAMAVSTTKTSNAGTKVSVSANATVSSNGQAKKLSVQGAIAKKAGVPTDSNGNPYINNKTDAEKYSKALIAYNKSKNKTAYFAGIATSSTGEPRINSAADAKAYTSALSSIAGRKTTSQSEKTNTDCVTLFVAEEGMKNTGEYDQKEGLTIDFSKTTYMSYSKVTDESSWQAGIRDDCFDAGGYTYVDENGLYRSTITTDKKSKDDYYIVAMGYKFVDEAKKYDSEYDENVATKNMEINDGKKLNYTSNETVNVGYTYKVDLTDSLGNDYSINVLIGSTKGESNSYVPHDNVIEFVVDGSPKGDILDNGGNIDYQALVCANSKTSISQISIYPNSARYTGTEFTGEWVRK